MRSIEDIRRELEFSRKQEDDTRSSALCREGLKLSTTPEMPCWFAFRFILATILLKSKGPHSQRDVEEAISLLTELGSHQPLSATEAERRKTLLALGRAFQLHTHGDRRASVQRSISAYTECLRYYTKGFDADTWALVKIQLGYMYSTLGASIGRSDYVAAIRCFNESIRCFNESLEVFSKSQYPVEWEEVQQALTEVRRRQRLFKAAWRIASTPE